MCGKRFVQVEDTSINDTLTGEKYYAPCEDDLLDLLNELSEENEKLKHYNLYGDNKRLQTIIADLKEENEQLRQEIVIYKKAFQQQVQRCTL